MKKTATIAIVIVRRAMNYLGATHENSYESM